MVTPKLFKYLGLLVFSLKIRLRGFIQKKLGGADPPYEIAIFDYEALNFPKTDLTGI